MKYSDRLRSREAFNRARTLTLLSSPADKARSIIDEERPSAGDGMILANCLTGFELNLRAMDPVHCSVLDLAIILLDVS